MKHATVLDIGSSKVVSMCAGRVGKDGLAVHGADVRAYEGYCAGRIVNTADLHRAIGESLMATQRECGFKLREVSISVPAPFTKVFIGTGMQEFSSPPKRITGEDIDMLINISLPKEEMEGYAYGADSQMEETGLWQKKVMATTAYKNDGSLYNTFSSAPEYYNSTADNFQLGHETDLIVIRYADILLMHSELSETTTGINQVRARVGLNPIGSYSLGALQKERRYELAFEGLRWGDIRRWGIAESALGKLIGQPIYNRGIATTMKNQGAGVVARYQATNGFMPLPSSEVDLSKGALKQNPGWGTDALYSSWAD